MLPYLKKNISFPGLKAKTYNLSTEKAKVGGTRGQGQAEPQSKILSQVREKQVCVIAGVSLLYQEGEGDLETKAYLFVRNWSLYL